MKQKYKLRWWLVFNITCFLSWLSVLIPGIITKNKTLIIAGLIYSVPFFWIFTLTKVQEKQKKIDEIIEQLSDTQNIEKFDSVKYSQAIKISKKLTEIKQKKDTAFNVEKIDQLSKIEENTKKDLETEIKKQNPELELSAYENTVYFIWLISVIAAIIHSIITIKKYNTAISNKDTETNTFVRNQNTPQKLTVEEKIITETEIISRRITERIKNSDEFDLLIETDIKEMTEKYSDQVKRLISELKYLKSKSKNNNIQETEKEIETINNKLLNETNPEIILEYQNLLDTKNKLLQSEKEILNETKTLELRMHNAVDSLKLVENELIKLEKVFDQNNKEQFFQTFEQKSAELKNYVSDVRHNYNKLQ